MKHITLSQSIGHLVHHINLSMKMNLEAKIRAHGLNSSHQFGILNLLSNRGAMSQKAIAQITLGDEPSTSRMIAKLIKSGFVEKNQSQEDKRAYEVSLTLKGSQLLTDVLPLVTEANETTLSSLDTQEQEQLLSLLQKVHKNLNN